MKATADRNSHRALALNTLAFTVCFAVWMMNGVLVTFLATNQVFDWSPVEIGWLMGIPVLTGSLLRLPAGILTDRFGGKPVFGLLLLLCAVPLYLLSHATTFAHFALCSFGFGLAGASFSVGIAFTSVWYPKQNQGVALGIFGAGNAGAAATTLLAPTLLERLTESGARIEGWRELPIYYAGLMVVMAGVFLLLSTNKRPTAQARTLAEMLRPLGNIRVWRFGLYYFLVFGLFVAFSQWLVPYFVNVYSMPLVTAGILAALFSFPSGVIRALGGWLSDRIGARRVMYWVLGSSLIISAMLVVPQMELSSPGRGIMCKADGKVTAVDVNSITVQGSSTAAERVYTLRAKPADSGFRDNSALVLPTKSTWQESVVQVGDQVRRKGLLAKGITRIYFQANVWILAVLAVLLGSVWGIGMAAVYKHIPDYFPDQVGVVGGMVGVLGGLGGFCCPIIFGYLLEWTGLWTSCWMFSVAISALCLFWMHSVVRGITARHAPHVAHILEDPEA
ncbi:MAG: MFS transporter [Planctomycetes bacterium]|jgi:NNP family nitrate/nitrite transporter-like MFS transporter|nr:MFS transporter [Planctomycetota bacterium]HJO27081.1 MFS transporter [Planctomycetota bacterium]